MFWWPAPGRPAWVVPRAPSPTACPLRSPVTTGHFHFFCYCPWLKTRCSRGGGGAIKCRHRLQHQLLLAVNWFAPRISHQLAGSARALQGALPFPCLRTTASQLFGKQGKSGFSYTSRRVCTHILHTSRWPPGFRIRTQGGCRDAPCWPGPQKVGSPSVHGQSTS